MSKATRKRRCIVTNEVADEACLIRFVVDPEGRVVPDIAAKLPGRGAWVRSERSVVNSAVGGKAFARAFGRRTDVRDDLLPLVEAGLARRCLDLLGLARRAGDAVSGFQEVRAWVRSGRAAVVFHASDGSERERERLASGRGGVASVTSFEKAELSLALGRESVVHAAVAVGGFADRIRREAVRLDGIRAAGGRTADRRDGGLAG